MGKRAIIKSNPIGGPVIEQPARWAGDQVARPTSSKAEAIDALALAYAGRPLAAVVVEWSQKLKLVSSM